MASAPEIARGQADDHVGLGHRIQAQLPEYAPLLAGLLGGCQHSDPCKVPPGALVVHGDELISAPAEQVAGGDAAQRVLVVLVR